MAATRSLGVKSYFHRFLTNFWNICTTSKNK